jgi:hypothetical protein
MLLSERLSSTRRRRIAASLAGSFCSSASAETPRLSEAGASLSGEARLLKKGRSSAPRHRGSDDPRGVCPSRARGGRPARGDRDRAGNVAELRGYDA